MGMKVILSGSPDRIVPGHDLCNSKNFLPKGAWPK